jgi:ferredoxin
MEIAYFTGTGNSLFVAEKIAERAGNTELVPIAAALKGKRKQPEKLGIVCPVYMHRLPHIVMDYVKALDHVAYLFLVGVNAGEIGRVFSITRKLLKGKDVEFRAGFSIEMPSNYLPFGQAVSGEERTALYEAAAGRAADIADMVSRGAGQFDREGSFFSTRIFPGLMYGMGHKYIRYLAKSFFADASCNGCGLCMDICPVGNIAMKEGRPVWGKNCQQCFACLNYCPKNAIQYGKSTAGRERYHHPRAAAARIIGQKGKA